MPELPEVETIVQSLRPHILQKEIHDMDIYLPKIVRFGNNSPSKLIAKVIISIFRQGKNIIIELSEGWHLRIHLKMTGQLLINLPHDFIQKHTHVIFYLDQKRLELRYRDVRQFGFIQILTPAEWKEWHENPLIGPDPLEISLSSFWERCKSKKGKIKPVLLDQGFLGGLGNIYVDEILHQAKIHPERLLPNLSNEEVCCLYQKMQGILREAIEYKGSSIRDYTEAFGERGRYQSRHRVYGRAGLPCQLCGELIKKMQVGNRGTYFCPQCQQK